MAAIGQMATALCQAGKCIITTYVHYGAPRPKMDAKWNLQIYKIRFSFFEPFLPCLPSKFEKIANKNTQIRCGCHKSLNLMLTSNPLKNANKFTQKNVIG
jgi:hypothetical protein